MISGGCLLLVEADMTSAATVGAPTSGISARRMSRASSWRIRYESAGDAVDGSSPWHLGAMMVAVEVTNVKRSRP
jgi:hypothetical protein